MKAIAQSKQKRKKSRKTVMLNNALIIAAINKIERYSARKINTNETEPNSVLKPLTSSDSPSEKSKGERLVSARDDTKRRIMMKNINVVNGHNFN